MKLLLLLGAFAIGTTATAQEFEPDIKKLMEKYPPKQLELPPVELATPLPDITVAGKRKLSPGVHALKQDGMPCVVPDTTDLAPMPNTAAASEDVPYGRMPNAAKKGWRVILTN